ncbi:MAG: aminotransferase class IV [Chloroflexi bacterium]|nr:aminotransferase class IV [Chloroflexota bacterium]
MLAYRLNRQSLIPIQTAAANPDELTRQLPRGLYTTFSTNHGGTRVLGLTAHLNRLNLPALASHSDLRRALSSLAESNAPGESRFRVIHSDSDGTVYVIVQTFAPPAREIYERGVRVVSADLVRHDARRKDSGFIAESQSQRAQVGGDVYEVLLTKGGNIYEGMTSNFYAVIASAGCEAISSRSRGLLRREDHPPRNDGGIVVTARTGILLGVTRRAVLRLARGEGMGIEYRPPQLGENFAEAFLTSSSRGIVPIVKIDEKSVGQGSVGAWTKRLSLAYAAYVEERSEALVE